MRFVVVAILLCLPAVDLYVTARIARFTGVPLWVWLTGSFLLGAFLLRSERVEFRARTVAALHGDQPVLRGMVDSGRKVLAGMFLIVPGVISDLIALLLLALPLNVGPAYARAGTRGKSLRW